MYLEKHKRFYIKADLFPAPSGIFNQRLRFFILLDFYYISLNVISFKFRVMLLEGIDMVIYVMYIIIYSIFNVLLCYVP